MAVEPNIYALLAWSYRKRTVILTYLLHGAEGGTQAEGVSE